jgi:hypothetical protein
MPLNSVQHYVKNLVNGLAIPAPIGKTLDTWITPPPVESMDQPHCYIWGGRVSPSRQTMPRTAGFKKYPWLIDIYLVYETSAQKGSTGLNPTLDSEFPVLIDAVLKVFTTTVMPILITDPDTGVISQIQHIGESWSLDYPVEKTPATMRMLWFNAMITMDVLEVVQQ